MPPRMNSIPFNVTREKPKAWQLILLALLILLLAVCVWAMTHTQTVRDWYILATYNPPSSVVKIAEQDTMTGYAKKLFYVNEPQIATKQEFAQHCPNSTEQTYVIGCYHSGDNGIYLLNVTDPRLNGIVPVTGAYEMLHAGYARLPVSERTKIDNEMQSYYTTHKLTPEIYQQMSAYAKTEPGARYDEMYSVLATEVSSLPTSLENHYKLYFTNRSAIVDMYNNYQAAFLSRQNQIAADNLLMTNLKTTINNNEAKLNSLLGNIKSTQNIMNSDQAQGQINEYNSIVPGYNSLVDQYNALVASTTQDINQYNSIVNSRNQLALEEQQLVSDLQSNPAQPISPK